MEGSQRGDWWRADREGTGGGQSEGGLVEGSQRGDWWRADKEGTGGRQTKRGLVEGRQRGPMAVGRQLLSQYRTRPNKLSAIGQVTVTGRGLCHRQVCVRLFVCVYVCACVRACVRACVCVCVLSLIHI